ncbi:hypothetical protein [Ideonella sp.]|uniref:hypothetical protein n=1 Tax=Ideonella sp. TaxID=1929293 RepID=UPI0035B3E973
MNATFSRAAAWAAPLFSHLHARQHGSGKQTHKLPPMPCVLWLPDYCAYVRSVNLLNASFTTSSHAEGAMRLAEDQAHAVGQDLIATTGVRVQLRAFNRNH